jgi:hypothetical protein
VSKCEKFVCGELIKLWVYRSMTLKVNSAKKLFDVFEILCVEKVHETVVLFSIMVHN